MTRHGRNNPHASLQENFWEKGEKDLENDPTKY
jgi:hypothetical protein